MIAAGACSANTTVTTTTPSTTTTSTIVATATTAEPPVECPAAPYEFEALPVDVGVGEPAAEDIEPDVWTSVPGSNTTFVPRADGSVAIALIRGTLPAVDWPAEKGEVFIDGTRAAVGPHPDGTWVAGWYEEPGQRCDLYTMVFYPPWAPADVEAVLDGMNRVGG